MKIKTKTNQIKECFLFDLLALYLMCKENISFIGMYNDFFFKKSKIYDLALILNKVIRSFLRGLINC